MTRRLLALLLVLSLSLGLSLPASAADSNASISNKGGGNEGEVSGPYTITKTAYVVESDDDTLTVYFPSFTVKNPGDLVRKLQKISIPQSLVITTGGGNAIAPRFVVPGQEIKITFSYQMRGTGELIEGDEKYPVRLLEIIDCQKIILVGKTLKLKEGVSIQELKNNVLVGTILTTSANSIQMYVEGGRVFYGSYEYLAQGQHTVRLDNSTRISDAQGRAVGGLKPFQRVEVKLSDTEWMESAPPQFAGGTCSSVKVLEYGDKFVVGMNTYHKMSCAVIRQQKDEYGNINLLVQPDAGARERYLRPQFIIKSDDYSSNVDRSTYTTGMRLDVSYLAINYDSTPGEIQYISEIKPNGLPAKTPAQMSEIFGNPGDVTLTAVPASIKAGAKTVKCVWKNKTDSKLEYGQSYTLERKIDGKWKKYGSTSRGGTNYAFTNEGYVLSPRGEAEFSFGLSAYTDKIEKGTYRIKTDFMDWRASGDYDMFTVYAEFTVE